MVERTTAFGALPPLAETFVERPVFGIKRPFTNAWGIRGARGGQISIQRRRRDAEPVRDLNHPDVGVREHRLGGLDVVVSQLRRPERTLSYARFRKKRVGASLRRSAGEFRAGMLNLSAQSSDSPSS